MAAALRLELVVVRHGLTQWNRERRYQGQRDIPLLIPDALPDLDRLRESLLDEHIDAVHCSDLCRCRQTLAHVFEGRDTMTPRFDPRLRELDFGDYEGRTYDQLKDDAGYRAWIDSRGELAPPGGESAEVLWNRLSDWLKDVIEEAQRQDHQRVLTVSHGGVIRELRRRLEAIDFWGGTVGQAQGRCFVIEYYGEGDWRCSSSSAVPALADAP
ncbi:histidine phosphatase family protein [Aidingimonas halophila]|uniref:Alpha-ribazole phosphatase n=1 Tax=Aidingimonas halophila TaxID=574349 RepID=A0A1H2XHQ9_9GAMM|nr:histidine phosphatase family protein [Aidingimonas halophila]GHC28752.1 hypothetical protein GCM10008094_20860 [Aidingimonas halophila]SDW92355.1 alpha-ribazole phosphatase [Aidingimonas halophila]